MRAWEVGFWVPRLSLWHGWFLRVRFVRISGSAVAEINSGYHLGWEQVGTGIGTGSEDWGIGVR